jgi:hypothetical protein
MKRRQYPPVRPGGAGRPAPVDLCLELPDSDARLSRQPTADLGQRCHTQALSADTSDLRTVCSRCCISHPDAERLISSGMFDAVNFIGSAAGGKRVHAAGAAP